MRCAAQGPPGGGPEDKTGPILLSSFPENGSVNIEPDIDITLNFSEPVEPRSVEANLEITPALGKAPVVRTSRKRVTISFNHPLKENTTYIISFGRGIRDYQKNLSEKSVTLAFSTGDSLDAGEIRGTVFDIPKKHNTRIWAYRKTDSFPDSLLGAVPDYQAAVEKDGSYRLTNLAKGAYRLLAVSSESPKILFVDENCQIGIPAIDPVIIDHRKAVVSGVNFRLSAFHLKPFRLIMADMWDDKLELTFSRPLDVLLNSDAIVKINRDAQIQSLWIDEADPQKMLLNFRGLIPDSVYTIQVENIFDDKGSAINTVNSAEFTYIAATDTIQPQIVATIPTDNVKNVDLKPVIQIRFSEAIEQAVTESSIDFINKDSLKIDFALLWETANVLKIIPREALEPAMKYRIRCNCSEWEDIYGNGFPNSLYTFSFTTVDINSYGSITGRVTFADSLVDNLQLCCKLDGESSALNRIQVEATGNYILNNLLPGVYRFEAWEDRNRNGRWDPGRLMPFETAEPYRSYPNEINVRARWETAEVNWVY